MEFPARCRDDKTEKMKAATQEQIKDLVSFYKDSAYAKTDEILKLAKELSEENDVLEEVEESLFQDIDMSLENYKYIECED